METVGNRSHQCACLFERNGVRCGQFIGVFEFAAIISPLVSELTRTLVGKEAEGEEFQGNEKVG